MQDSDTIAVSPDVVAREVSGEMVLLDLESGMYFGLDAVGAFVWAKLAERAHTFGDLVDGVAAEYDAPRDRIETDLHALFADLSEKGLVVTGAEAA